MRGETHARRLADEIAGPPSRWHEPVATVPRHVFVPRWWEHTAPGWTRSGETTDEDTWLRAAYSDDTHVTSVAGRHADHAEPGERVSGLPSSSSTLPSLVVRMLRHGHVYDGADILDVGTGSGYSAALLARRFGGSRVTTVDVDPYLTTAATDRLHRVDLTAPVTTCDATSSLPGTYDRIVSMVSVRPIPMSWLAALRPGGRLVTTISGMFIITATKTADGGAVGRVEWDRASFMRTRSRPADHPVMLEELLNHAEHAPGERVSRGAFPVVDVGESWELASMLELETPGVEVIYDGERGQPQTLVMAHPDGSWARATMRQRERPEVHQSGPRRLWDTLDRLRSDWLDRGRFELFGAHTLIDPDGAIHFARGDWRAHLPSEHRLDAPAFPES